MLFSKIYSPCGSKTSFEPCSSSIRTNIFFFYVSNNASKIKVDGGDRTTTYFFRVSFIFFSRSRHYCIRWTHYENAKRRSGIIYCILIYLGIAYTKYWKQLLILYTWYDPIIMCCYPILNFTRRFRICGIFIADFRRGWQQ